MSYRERLDPRDSRGDPIARLSSSNPGDGKPRQDSDTIPPKLFSPLPPLPKPKPKEGNADNKRLGGNTYRSLGSSASRSRFGCVVSPSSLARPSWLPPDSFFGYRRSYGQQSRFDDGSSSDSDGGRHYGTSRAQSDGDGDPVPSSPTIPPQYPQPKRSRSMRSSFSQGGQGGVDSGSDSSEDTVAAHGRSGRSQGGMARSSSGLRGLGESSSSSATMRSLARGDGAGQAHQERQRRREREEIGCSSDTDNE